jgi:Fe2+ or Zn2+ uptake regulation protein
MEKEIPRRNTLQRSIILEELKKTKSHPTADSLFKAVRRRVPSISFGTVYRNLNFLKNQGQILELTCGRYSCRYNGNVQNHYHFFCLRCKKVFDLNEPILKNFDGKISKNSGMAVRYHRLDFYGYCRSCKS